MIPDREGVWEHLPSGMTIGIYPLDPANGILCFWGPDIGITYSSAADTQGCWATDEFQGHVPVGLFDNDPQNWRRSYCGIES